VPSGFTTAAAAAAPTPGTVTSSATDCGPNETTASTTQPGANLGSRIPSGSPCGSTAHAVAVSAVIVASLLGQRRDRQVQHKR
jgi:hypothetical protein